MDWLGLRPGPSPLRGAGEGWKMHTALCRTDATVARNCILHRIEALPIYLP